MQKYLKVVVSLAAAACLFPAWAVAAGPPAHQVAAANLAPSGIDWTPQISYDRLVLTVSGPDGVVRQSEFPEGTSPVLEVVDANGTALPDGSYTWELRAVPKLSAAMRQAMAAARANGEPLPAGLPSREHLTQTGYFQIQNGAIVNPGAVEAVPEGAVRKVTAPSISKITAADQVFADDVIVQGSLCVGFDCVNNESFGFDTIRLKENNTRIKFEDTSNSGSFPTQDWQITANDSTNGGKNKFSIDAIAPSTGTPFTIEAGAPSSSIYVTSAGRLGLGTSTPAVDVQVTTGNSPTVRLEQDGSSGFTPQTWDLAGNEANFFIRDVTNGSKLPFRIRPGAPTSSIDIAASGNIGIGTQSPSNAVTVEKSTNSFMRFNRTSSGVGWIFGVAENPVDDFVISLAGSGQSEFLLDSSGTGTFHGAVNATAFNTTSSRTLKDNFKQIEPEEILARLAAIPVLQWSFKNDSSQTPHLGPMAEDFQAAFHLGNTDKRINLMDAAGVAFAAIKGLNQKVVALEAEKAELRKELDQLRAMVETLEQQSGAQP